MNNIDKLLGRLQEQEIALPNEKELTENIMKEIYSLPSKGKAGQRKRLFLTAVVRSIISTAAAVAIGLFAINHTPEGKITEKAGQIAETETSDSGNTTAKEKAPIVTYLAYLMNEKENNNFIINAK